MNLRFGFPIAASALAILSGCTNIDRSFSLSFSDSDFKAVTNLTQTGAIPADLKRLEVDNRFGNVRVVGSEKDPVEWTWKLTVRARTEALAQLGAAQAACNAQRDGDRLRLVVSLPETDRKYRVQSDLDLRLPKPAAVRVQNRFGSIEISDVDGELEATGQHGAMELRNIGAPVRAQTSFAIQKVSATGPASLKNQHGAIEAANIRGPLTAETSFGAILAQNITGPVKVRNQHGKVEVRHAGPADLRTCFAMLSAKGIEGDAILVNEHGHLEASEVSGSLHATTSFESLDLTTAGPSVVCHNQHGPIRIHVTSAMLTNLQATTSFGPLEVSLPAGLKPALQARTSFAEIESDFPVLMKLRGTDPFADAPPDTPRISVENSHGRIRVMRH